MTEDEHREQDRDTYLIPLQQVVCDFGSVVTWGLWTTGKWAERGRRRQGRDEIS